MAESGQDRVLAGDILRRRALDLIMEASTAVDAEGERIDLRAPAGEDADPDMDRDIVGLDDGSGPGDDSADSPGEPSAEGGSPGDDLVGNGSDDRTPDEEA
jgi:hypothetical protein